MSLARLVHRSRPFEPTARVCVALGVGVGTARTGIGPIARASRSQASIHPFIHAFMRSFIGRAPYPVTTRRVTNGRVSVFESTTSVFRALDDDDDR